MSFSARAGSQVGWSGALDVAVSLFFSLGFFPEGGAGSGAGAAPGGSSPGGGAGGFCANPAVTPKAQNAARHASRAAERFNRSCKQLRRNASLRFAKFVYHFAWRLAALPPRHSVV